MGSSATTGALLHSLLLLSTLVCCTRASGLLGFEEDGTTSIVEILKKDVCCMRRFRTKTIEQAHYQNNIRYNCKATVRQAYCGGNCKSDSTYLSGIMRLNKFFQPAGWADKPSATVTDKVCSINTAVTQTYQMRCRAEKGCCQDVSQEEITVSVQVTEPASGDNGCTCDTQTTATPIFPCALKPNFQYLYFYPWPWKCRSFFPVYLPYCSGCCSGYEDFFFVLSPLWRRMESKKCQCCGGTKYGYKKVTVYCWWLLDYAEYARDDRQTVTKPDGSVVSEKEYNSAGFKFETVLVWYIQSCGCTTQQCQ